MRRHRTHQAVARSAPVDDPRWKQVQQQLGDQQKALADNQKQIADTQANLEQAKSELNGNLESARTELGGDIARNHDELVALEKKGERTYYEFSFEKSPTYHHTGPISIALRKADTKHEYCDLQMVVDDKAITRKHINLYESVTLYPEGYTQPLELVINRIDKDSVKGYVSEPKVRSKEQAAAPATPHYYGCGEPARFCGSGGQARAPRGKPAVGLSSVRLARVFIRTGKMPFVVAAATAPPRRRQKSKRRRKQAGRCCYRSPREASSSIDSLIRDEC